MWNNSIISKPTIQTVQGRFIEKVALIWLDNTIQYNTMFFILRG